MFPVIIVFFSFFLFLGGGKRQIIFLLKTAFPTGACMKSSQQRQGQRQNQEKSYQHKVPPQAPGFTTGPSLKSKDFTTPLSNLYFHSFWKSDSIPIRWGLIIQNCSIFEISSIFPNLFIPSFLTVFDLMIASGLLIFLST